MARSGRTCCICFAEKYEDEPGAYCQDCSAVVSFTKSPERFGHLPAEYRAERDQRIAELAVRAEQGLPLKG